MSFVRVAAAAAVAGAVLVGVRVVSYAPISIRDSHLAMIRVSLSARPERVEVCRTVGADELANIPQHMRQSVVCEGYTAQYQLDVRRNDSLLVRRVVRGGGLRRDRHLYVLEEIDIPAGSSVIDVRLTRLGDPRTNAGGVDSTPQESEERMRRREDEVPPSLVLRESLDVAPGRVVLVTYDRTQRALQVSRGDTP